MQYKIGTKDKPMLLKTPPLTIELELVEVTHDPKANKMRNK